MKVLVTGISGFVGRHMAAWLIERDIEVVGTVRTAKERQAASFAGRIRTVGCELNEWEDVDRLLACEQPDGIIHLAAQSSVPAAWAFPVATLMNNAAAQIHLLEAARRHCPNSRIVLACSGDEYGDVRLEELPVKETNPLRPTNPYALSKAVQDFLAYGYYQNYGIPLIRCRSFNHIGPGQSDQFAISSFARQIAEIEAGYHPPVLLVGNLEAKRDFTDVRDVVCAYGLLLEQGTAGDAYNICSGKAYAIEDLLHRLLQHARAPIDIQPDLKRMRPSDVILISGDASKLHAATGWQPTICMEQTLLDILQDWRIKVREGAHEANR